MKSFPKELSNRPKSKEVEITLLGKGVGECVIIHTQDDRWIVIDSHKNPETKRPVALDYFDLLGVGYDKVEFIIVSHWDKDHIDGVAELISQCKQAKVCMPAVFTQKDFSIFIETYKGNENSDFSLNEIYKAIYTAASQRRLVPLFQDKVIIGEQDCRMHSLSPTDDEFKDFLRFLGTKIPELGASPLKIADRVRNFISSVILLEFSGLTILLGADMMSSGSRERGWAAIIDTSTVLKSLKNKATYYKVAHHGGASGDHLDVWDKLLSKDPVACLAPFTPSPVPSKKDIMRLEAQTKNGYIASSPFKRLKPAGRHPMVKSAVQPATQRNLKVLDTGLGLVRARTIVDGTIKDSSHWDVEVFPKGMKISDLKTSIQWLEHP